MKDDLRDYAQRQQDYQKDLQALRGAGQQADTLLFLAGAGCMALYLWLAWVGLA